MGAFVFATAALLLRVARIFLPTRPAVLFQTLAAMSGRANADAVSSIATITTGPMRARRRRTNLDPPATAGGTDFLLMERFRFMRQLNSGIQDLGVESQ